MPREVKMDTIRVLADNLRDSPDPEHQLYAAVIDGLIANASDPRIRRSMLSRFQRRFREAAVPLASRGWVVHTSRIVRESAGGNWARIYLVGNAVVDGELWVHLDGHLYSGTLLRLLERTPPKGEPDGRKFSSHLYAFNCEMHVTDRADAQRPAAYPIRPKRAPVLDGALTRESAGPWLADLIERFAAKAEAWAVDDRTMRDALIETCGDRSDEQLRFAAILSRVIGDEATIPGLLAEADHRWRQSQKAFGSSGWGNDFDRTREFRMWSHERFVRFLDRDLPKRMRERLG